MESRVFGRFFQLLHSHFSRGHLKTRISLPKEYAKSAYSVSRRNTSTISMVEETLNEQRSEGPAERFTVVTKMFFEDEVKRNSVPTEMVYEQHCELLGSVIGSEKEARKVIIKSPCGAVNAFLTMEQVTALRRCADANGPENPEVAHVLHDLKIIPF